MKRWVGPTLLAAFLVGCTPSTLTGTGPEQPAEAVATGAPTQPPAAAPQESPGQIPIDWVPTLQSVTTLQLHLGLPTPKEQTPQPLYATHPQHRVTIAALLDLLAQTQLAAGELSMPARSPSVHLALRGRGTLSLRLAYNCKPFSSEDGHGYSCRQAPGELILQTRGGQEVRVKNPPLATWLQSGWREEIPLGALPDMEKEMALAIARGADPRAKWQATFFEEYPVESRGGTVVLRAWMVEAEYPSGSKTRLVINAQSGEIIRLGQLEAWE